MCFGLELVKFKALRGSLRTHTREGAEDASEFASSLFVFELFVVVVVVVVLDRVVVTSLFPCGCCIFRHHIVEVVVQVICCRVVVRRGQVLRSGTYSSCSLCVYWLLFSVECVVTTSPCKELKNMMLSKCGGYGGGMQRVRCGLDALGIQVLTFRSRVLILDWH